MTTVLERPRVHVDADDRFLVSRVGSRRCALPIDHVTETTGPLACEPLAGAPEFVLGVAEVRGAAVPVVDTGVLLGSTPSRAARVVSLAVDGRRRVALAVDDVIGVSAMTDDSVHPLPPLVEVATGAVIEALGVVDAELVIFLRESRLVPESVWGLIELQRNH